MPDKPSAHPAPHASALREQERLIESQRLRVRAAGDRLRRQADPVLCEALADELRFQEDLLRGLIAGRDALREKAVAELEADRAAGFLAALHAARDQRVEGEERRALIAEVKARLRGRG